ncbi:MAG: AI-2E family transporter [Eubacterium sp.]|nr:AI-2E family transporter [Eubacterium sp.]
MKEEKKYIKRLKMVMSNIWYIIAIVAICTAVVMMIINWTATLAAIGKIISVLMPFILGFLFAYLIIPLVRMIEKLLDHVSSGKGLKIKKAFSLIISYMFVIGILVVIVVFVAPQIVQSVRELGKTVQQGYTYIKANPTSFLDWIPFVKTEDVMTGLKDNIMNIATNASTVLFPYVYSTLTSTFVVAYDIFFGIVISIYMTWEKDSLAKGLHRLVYSMVPPKYSDGFWEKLIKSNRIFNGFLLGKAIDSLIIGILTFILMLIFGFPYPVLLSVIVGITNMIPYFGPIIGAIPGCAIYLFIDPMLAVWFALLILAIQQFDGWILGPWILGDQTGIKPLTVILGITLGGAYFGVLGMFLGVPTVAVIQYLGGEFIKTRFRKKGIKDPALITENKNETDSQENQA